MKKAIIISCTVASLALILDSLGAWQKIMMFVFVGIIPGTDSALTPEQMLALISVITSLVIVKAGILPVIRKIKMMNVKPHHLTARRLKRA